MDGWTWGDGAERGLGWRRKQGARELPAWPGGKGFGLWCAGRGGVLTGGLTVSLGKAKLCADSTGGAAGVRGQVQWAPVARPRVCCDVRVTSVSGVGQGGVRIRGWGHWGTGAWPGEGSGVGRGMWGPGGQSRPSRSARLAGARVKRGGRASSGGLPAGGGPSAGAHVTVLSPTCLAEEPVRVHRVPLSRLWAPWGLSCPLLQGRGQAWTDSALSSSRGCGPHPNPVTEGCG